MTPAFLIFFIIGVAMFRKSLTVYYHLASIVLETPYDEVLIESSLDVQVDGLVHILANVFVRSMLPELLLYLSIEPLNLSLKALLVRSSENRDDFQ